MKINVVVPFNRFPEIAGRLEARTNDAVNTALLSAAERADPATPVDTGALRANKTVEAASGGTGSITWNQEYAAFVHNGTSRMAPRPFAQEAIDAVTPSFLADLQRLGFS